MKIAVNPASRNRACRGVLMNSNRDGLVVVAVGGDNHLRLSSVSPAEPDALGSVTFQDERQSKPGEGGQRTGDLSAKDHPHHFPSLEIVQSAARSSASR